MEKYRVQKDLQVFGLQVMSFPYGIGEAFGNLMEMIPNGKERAYYGISYFDNAGNIVYHAAAEEKYSGEAEKYNCKSYTIEKGEYLAIKLAGWRSKTDKMKELFHELMIDERTNKSKPCIEWYYNDDEMMCMMLMKDK